MRITEIILYWKFKKKTHKDNYLEILKQFSDSNTNFN